MFLSCHRPDFPCRIRVHGDYPKLHRSNQATPTATGQIFESSSSPQVEDVPIKAVILGEAYIKRGLKAGKPDRFVCPIGETGKARLMSGSDFLFNPRSHFASWAIGKIFQL